MVTQCNTDVPEARMQPVDQPVDKGSYQRDAYLFYWILFWNDKGKFSILTPSPSLKMSFGFPGTLEVINGMEEVPICDSQAQRLMKYSGIIEIILISICFFDDWWSLLYFAASQYIIYHFKIGFLTTWGRWIKAIFSLWNWLYENWRRLLQKCLTFVAWTRGMSNNNFCSFELE